MPTQLSLSDFELGILAIVLNEELKRIEYESPLAFRDPETYASNLKVLHRRILSTIPKA